MRKWQPQCVVMLGALLATTLCTARLSAAPAAETSDWLDKKLPELKFDAVPFADVIEFLRDSTRANITVNWRALEAAGIDKNAPVTTRLRDVKLSKVLRTILDDVGGGTVKLGYILDEGVITVSTDEELANNMTDPGLEIGDEISVYLDVKRANSPIDSELRGTLEYADTAQLRLRRRTVAVVALADGTSHNVERESIVWIPRPSILYIEKIVDEKAEPAKKPVNNP